MIWIDERAENAQTIKFSTNTSLIYLVQMNINVDVPNILQLSNSEAAFARRATVTLKNQLQLFNFTDGVRTDQFTKAMVKQRCTVWISNWQCSMISDFTSTIIDYLLSIIEISS